MEEQPHIGRLNEHQLHAALKSHMEPDCRYHEINCLGYVCDIFKDGVYRQVNS